MLDNDQIRLFLPIIKDGLLAQSITATIISAYQPSRQGLPTGNIVFFNKVLDKILGFPKRESIYNSITGKNDNIDTQKIETTWQIGTLIKQKAELETITASDLLNLVNQILSSSQSLNIFNNAGVGIVRITDIRNPYFTDDFNEFEASPSLDFTILHNRTYKVIGENLSNYDLTIDRV